LGLGRPGGRTVADHAPAEQHAEKPVETEGDGRGWRLIHSDPADSRCARFLSSTQERKLLMIEKPATASSLKLERDLPAPQRNGGEIGLGYSYVQAPGLIVQWVSILRVDPAGLRHPLEKLSAPSEDRQFGMVSGFSRYKAPSPLEGNLVLTIQLSRTAGLVEFERIDLEGFPPVDLQAIALAPLAEPSAQPRRITTALTEQLKCSTDPDFIAEGVRALFEMRDREGLLKLFDHVGGIDAPITGDQSLRAQLLHYHARYMADLNACETAYNSLKFLLSHMPLAEALSDTDVVRVQKFLADLCSRTGRADEAAGIYRTLLRDRPLDWEPYYHLGLMQPLEKAAARRFYYNAAEALSDKMQGNAVTAIAESYIDEDAPEEAIRRAALGLKAWPDSAELRLTLGNAFLAIGEKAGWLAHLQGYFDHFGLSGPDLADEEARQHILHMRSGGERPAPAGPLVTVIMTAFNAGDTLRFATRSVLDQSHANLRLVIVDDASDDDTRNLIEQIAAEDERVVPLFNDRNLGTYCSKNRALQQFESDFYAFHDSDDWMHPDHLKEHLLATEGDIKVTLSMWLRIDPSGRAIVRRNGGYLQENPASTFFSADVRELVGYFDSVRSGADTEFVWRARHILGHPAVRHIRKPLALGLHRRDSLTQSGAAAFDEHRFSPVRLRYWEAWAKWHHEVLRHSEPASLFIPYPLTDRKFEAPEEILVPFGIARHVGI